MDQYINKLTNAELAQGYINIRAARGLKTTKQDALDAVADVFKMVDTFLQTEDIGIIIGKTGVLYNGLQKGRVGRHPQSGLPLIIPDLRAIKYKPAPKYKNRLNGK